MVVALTFLVFGPDVLLDGCLKNLSTILLWSG